MNQNEFIAHINNHRAMLYKICNMYCPNYNADDLVQDILLNAWKSAQSWRQNAKFSTWLYALARNTAIAVYRKISKEPVIIFNNGIDYGRTTINGDAELQYKIAAAEMYDTVISNLPIEERDFFILYLEGLPYKEIEKQTNINENLLRVKINRIKKRLRLRYGSK